MDFHTQRFLETLKKIPQEIKDLYTEAVKELELEENTDVRNNILIKYSTKLHDVLETFEKKQGVFIGFGTRRDLDNHYLRISGGSHADASDCIGDYQCCDHSGGVYRIIKRGLLTMEVKETDKHIL